MKATRSATRSNLPTSLSNGAESTQSKKTKRKHSEEALNGKPAKQRRKDANITKKVSQSKTSPSPKKLSANVKEELREDETPITSPKKSKSAKANNYSLTPGQSPFPDWPHPTPDECEEVVCRLSKLHGKVQAPKKIPTPSLQTSGCGEVPSVLDALVRTRLSAATSNANSSRAFRGLVTRFGTIKSGIGKGSVNWDAVRCADTKDVYETIKCGGLADVKSRDIKTILQMVWEENQERRNALINMKTENTDTREVKDNVEGAEDESKNEIQEEIAKSEENVVSLDHLHLLSNDEAFAKLIKYPGVGPKTASCVLLFCLQRPSFAVDTHVFRLCKWLNWVPPNKATRNTTYAHCDARIPDKFKYPLHKLLIKHGQTCDRCRVAGNQKKTGKIRCVLSGLMKEKKSRVTADEESSAQSDENQSDYIIEADTASDARK